jgi:uncharacterized membrane protein YgaE (UPF0421/DUF939 family)
LSQEADKHEPVSSTPAPSSGPSSLRARFGKLSEPGRLLLALQLGIIAAATYFLGTTFTGFFHNASASLGAIWCAITAIAVLQSTRQATWREGIRQLLGTLLGVSIGGVYLVLFAFSPIGMGICVAVTVLLCELIGIADTTKLAATSVVMIMVISYYNPDLSPLVNSALRFSEACIGALVAMTVSLIPARSRT